MRFRRALIAIFALAVTWCGLGIDPALAEYDMPYYIDLELTNQIVTIYNTKDDSIARQMLCSAGMNDATPTGTWYLPAKKLDEERSEWWYFRSFHCYAKYATRIYYAYFFHSITFDKKSDDAMNATAAANFGVPASHGCIRLRIEDARFIAQNCLQGTRVRIFKSGVKNEDLRTMLYVSSFREEDGLSYQEFLGISPDALGYGSSGTEVEDLQLRLRDLGYYGNDIDGRYETNTITAVKTLQKDLGLAQSGITTAELKEVIYSEEAPVSAGQITMQEGSSGPAVKKFQQALQRLGIYDGAIDSVYDADVVNAVKALQLICGFTADGVATPEIQHLAYYELNRIEQALGEDFQVERVSEEINMATMTFQKAKVIVRSKPDTKSDAIAKLSKGDEVVLLATKDDWAQVFVNGQTGYMYKKYLSPHTQDNYVLRYTANDKSITIGNTLEEYVAGTATNEQQEFANYYASAQYTEYLDEPVEYVTINTGADSTKLNLRADPSSEGAVLAEVPNGTNLRVLAKEAEWTRVGYGDQIGYLMNQYLNFWEGSADDVEDTSDAVDEGEEEGGEDTLITAIVMPNKKDGRVNVYQDADEESEVIDRIRGDEEVIVISADEDQGWALIRYKDTQGYMQDKNLSFRLMA